MKPLAAEYEKATHSGFALSAKINMAGKVAQLQRIRTNKKQPNSKLDEGM